MKGIIRYIKLKILIGLDAAILIQINDICTKSIRKLLQ